MRDIATIFRETKTIAVIGLSDKPHRDSYRVARYLQAHGYRIVPVNPEVTEILGQKAYPDLASVPIKVDMVDIFRRSEYVLPIAQQAVQSGAGVLWMQDGVINEQAAELARSHGLDVVMDDCALRQHSRLSREGLL